MPVAVLSHQKEFLNAVQEDDLEHAEELLNRHGPDLFDVVTLADDHAVGLAARGGSVEMLRLLVSNGASFDDPGFSGATPLYEAAYEGHLAAVRYLVGLGANVNSKCASGTPLTGSIYEGHIDVMRVLLDAGAKVYEESDDEDRPNALVCEDGWSAADWTLLTDNVEAFRELHIRGMIPIDEPYTALDWVLGEPEREVPKIVLDCLSDPELSGVMTSERLQSYIRDNENDKVLAVLRAELLSMELRAAMGEGQIPAPEPVQRRSADLGL